MRLSEWLKPPRNLLAVLVAITLAAVLTLTWLGWRLLEQERALEAQRNQERLDIAADRAVAAFRGELAILNGRLDEWATDPRAAPPDEVTVLAIGSDRFSARPPQRLPYYPFASDAPEAPLESFSAAEALEFRGEHVNEAAAAYRRLAMTQSAPVRAGALLRLGRVLRKTGDLPASLPVYRQLGRMSGVAVSGVPADLLGIHAQCEVLEKLGTGADLARTAQGFARSLRERQWCLTRGQFEFYRSEANRFLRAEGVGTEGIAEAEAAETFWQAWKSAPAAKGEQVLWVGTRPALAIWKSLGAQPAALLVGPEYMLKRASAGDRFRVALADGEGRVVAGAGKPGGRAVMRSAAETRLPWTVQVSSVEQAVPQNAAPQRRLVVVGLSVVLLLLVAGSYFVGRAIRIEAEVLRLQSEFVAAVSHEFRTPVATIRQLGEMLEMGRIEAAERRQQYYELIVGESRRLQRLVETLLNFGKLEAGGSRSRFEAVDTAELISTVAAGFQPDAATSGQQIDLSGVGAGLNIQGDRDAISVALRNLIDNALKYSPGRPVVWVECASEGDRVAIRVKDEGLGVSLRERKAIFRKFVRGTAAASASVRGTGVGLAMVNQIAASHGGRVEIESEPGKGSTFTLWLPGASRL